VKLLIDLSIFSLSSATCFLLAYNLHRLFRKKPSQRIIERVSGGSLPIRETPRMAA